MTPVDAAAIVAFAGVVVGLAVLAWSLLTGDEHLADVEDDDEDRPFGGGW